MPTKSQQSVSSSTPNDTQKSPTKLLTQIDASLIAPAETNKIIAENTASEAAAATIISADDGCDATVAAFYHPYEIAVTETTTVPQDEPLNTSTDDFKNRKPLNLKLNVIVTDTDEPNPDQTNKTKKKFYESDDTFINAIFSQTITSTTVTPTDEELSYTFDPPDLQAPLETAGTNVPNERIECDSDNGTDLDLDDDGEYADGRPLTTANTDWITVEEATHPDLSSYNESHTENLDNYNETMISFTDTICLDHDPDDIDADQMNVNETTDIPDDRNEYENIYVNDKQRFSIVIDCFDDNEAISPCCYVEPTTPVSEADANVAATVAAVASYFDQTIDDDADDGFAATERNRSYDGNGSQDEDDDEEDDEEDEDDEESDTESIGNGIDRNHCVGVHVSVAFNMFNKRK